MAKVGRPKSNIYKKQFEKWNKNRTPIRVNSKGNDKPVEFPKEEIFVPLYDYANSSKKLLAKFTYTDKNGKERTRKIYEPDPKIRYDCYIGNISGKIIKFNKNTEPYIFSTDTNDKGYIRLSNQTMIHIAVYLSFLHEKIKRIQNNDDTEKEIDITMFGNVIDKDFFKHYKKSRKQKYSLTAKIKNNSIIDKEPDHVHHIDKDKNNNRLDNLQYLPQFIHQDIVHSFVMGTKKPDEIKGEIENFIKVQGGIEKYMYDRENNGVIAYDGKIIEKDSNTLLKELGLYDEVIVRWYLQNTLENIEKHRGKDYFDTNKTILLKFKNKERMFVVSNNADTLNGHYENISPDCIIDSYKDIIYFIA